MNATQPFLSVVIPAYREEKLLPKMLDTVLQYCSAWDKTYEIIVVDDGSPDQTSRVAGEYAVKNSHVRLIRHPKNMGKGAAVRTGMTEAKGKYTLFTDADNSTPFEEVTKLLAAIEEGYDIVMGSRYLAGSDVRKKQSAIRRFMSRGGNFLFWVLLGLRFTDTRCGFKLFNEQARLTVFKRQTLERWGFDTEILVIANRHHLRVKEVPVIWYDRERGNIRPFRDSMRALTEILEIRLAMSMGKYD